MISSVFLGLCVLLAVAPPRRGGVPGFLVFLYCFLASELPFLALYYIVESTVQGAIQNNVNTPLGWTAVGLSAAAVLGTGVIIARELRVGPVLDRALAEGLGADMIPPRTGPLPWVRILICPVLMRRRGVRRVANISYGDAGRHNRLDVYQPRSPVADAPVFVHFHGGGMVMGSKNRESPSPVIYAELPGAQHAFDRFHTISFDKVATAVESFAAWAAASTVARAA